MRRALDLLGRGLIGAGVLVLLFVAYQLWGTGLVTARQQSQLKEDFAEARAAVREHDDDRASPRTVPGDAVALIEIPQIGLDAAVVEGVGADDLRKGPGHYPGTVLPGVRGNAAVAGHRTTYGAPFNRLDDLEPGDRIEVTTLEGRFVYRVRDTTVVDPSSVEVLAPTDATQLTLTTCHPEYSARRRLVVVAGLDTQAGDRARAPARRPSHAPADLDAGGDSGWSAADLGTVVWTGAFVLVLVGWWALARRLRRWPATVAGALPVLGVLFFFFTEVEQLLPANF